MLHDLPAHDATTNTNRPRGTKKALGTTARAPLKLRHRVRSIGLPLEQRPRFIPSRKNTLPHHYTGFDHEPWRHARVQGQIWLR